MSYVDKVKKAGKVYEIHDARLEVTAEDVGKVVTVNEAGELVLAETSGGLEIIEWDGERNFTQEEYAKLREFKAVVYHIDNGYYLLPLFTTETSVVLSCISVEGNSAYEIYINSIEIQEDGQVDILTENNSLNEYVGTKLYKHILNFDFSWVEIGDGIDACSVPLEIITTSPTPITLNSLESNPIVVISGSDDEWNAITTVRYYSSNDELHCNFASLLNYIHFKTITNFTDTVTPL